MKKIISLDHGNRLMKSPHHVFPSSFVESKYLPSIGTKRNQNENRWAQDMSAYAQQVSDIRTLCCLFVEQQDSILQLISDKLDELEADLSGTDADKEGLDYGK